MGLGNVVELVMNSLRQGFPKGSIQEPPRGEGDVGGDESLSGLGWTRGRFGRVRTWIDFKRDEWREYHPVKRWGLRRGSRKIKIEG